MIAVTRKHKKQIRQAVNIFQCFRSNTFAGSQFCDVPLGTAAGKPTLKTMSVKGVVNNVVIDVTGAITSVSVGAFVNSRLFASYSGPDDGSGTFTAGGDIGTFKVTGDDTGPILI